MSAKQKRFLWPAVIAVAAIFTALLLVSARTKATAPKADTPPNTSPTTSAAVAEKSEPVLLPQNDSAKERLEAELVVAQPNGFEPKQITRPAGQFILIVDNRTGLEQIQVRLERVAGRERLHDIDLTKRAYSWNTLLKLPPGDYVLTEANHPEWACRITLTPN